jgi:hypothetical protein
MGTRALGSRGLRTSFEVKEEILVASRILLIGFVAEFVEAIAAGVCVQSLEIEDREKRLCSICRRDRRGWGLGGEGVRCRREVRTEVDFLTGQSWSWRPVCRSPHRLIASTSTSHCPSRVKLHDSARVCEACIFIIGY